MQLSAEQATAYADEGYVFLPRLLPEAQVREALRAADATCTQERPQVIRENDGATVSQFTGLMRSAKTSSTII